MKNAKGLEEGKGGRRVQRARGVQRGEQSARELEQSKGVRRVRNCLENETQLDECKEFDIVHTQSMTSGEERHAC